MWTVIENNASRCYIKGYETSSDTFTYSVLCWYDFLREARMKEETFYICSMKALASNLFDAQKPIKLIVFN